MLNVVILIGRLTHTPEPRTTRAGDTVVNFSLAVQRSRVNKATGQRDTDFVDCTAFGKTADFITRYFAKGQLMNVKGELHTSKYTDRNGNNRTKLEVCVDGVEFVESKSKEPTIDVEPPEQPQKQIVPAPEGDFAMIEDSDEDPPF